MTQSTQLGNGVALFRRLFRYVMPYRAAFAVAVTGMMVSSLSEASFAWLMKPMLDGNFVDKDPFWIRLVPYLLLAAAVTRGLASYTAQYLMGWVGRNVIKTMRQRVFQHLLVLPKAYYDKTPTGHLLSKMTFDVEQLALATTQAVTILVRDSIAIIALLSLMFYHNWVLSLVFLLVSPCIALLVRVVNQRFRRISTRIQQSMGDVTQITEQAISAQNIIKTYRGQDYEAQQFAAVNNRNRQQNMKLVATREASVQLTQIIVSICLAAIVYLATLPAMLDAITVGTFVSFMIAMMMLLSPIKRLTTVNAILQRGIAAADSLFTLLDVEPEQDHGSIVLERARGEIDFQHVCFEYEASDGRALHDITFHIAAGQTVAIVGRSGSGKTTLVNLLPRFYQPSQGCILLDGQDIQALRLSSLREQISLVGQHVTMFNDTIARNIAYGDETIDPQRLQQAVHAAHADQFIARLPDGLETLIGENGMLLSGGQRQRLAIARALYKDAPILILDEATSSLDSESEQHIQAALENLMGSRTTLVIAHRLSTIKRADRIIVMEEGRIVETGHHDELLQRNGHYQHLYQLQFAGSGEAVSS